MIIECKNSLDSLSEISVNNKKYKYFSLKKASAKLGFMVDKLPYSMKVLFENVLRNEDGKNNNIESLTAFALWIKNDGKSDSEISVFPSRVLMQDFTGVPAIVDLAAMRDAMIKLGGDPSKINPLIPVDLVIDHSVQVDFSSSKDAFAKNVSIEMKRNRERYEFLSWGQKSFKNFRVVPPGTGICHQVNLEYLADVVSVDGNMAFPDTVVGTDSHTTMINGLSVLGWGVGGIEAEAGMLGQALPMLLPEVIGVKLTGTLPNGITATDLVLRVTEILRSRGVVGKFVEFFGPGIAHLALADRATIANMAPEYGATCGFFPVDEETIKYLKLTSRSEDTIHLVEHYAKEQSLWRSDENQAIYTDIVDLDLASLEPSIAGPKRPQDRVELKNAASEFKKIASNNLKDSSPINNGDVVIAAITSCTNTSNPSVMIAAGLLAKKAIDLGLSKKPWVKTSLAPGSKVVTEYLKNSGLDVYLDKLGFNLVGYGCTTCIGNSGPLDVAIESAVTQNNLTVVSVLSGNRNFEGRVHPLTKANYLASPPLVVAYAIAGNIGIDVTTGPIGSVDGKDIYLSDIWPSNDEISHIVNSTVSSNLFASKYKDVFSGDDLWKSINVSNTPTYNWDKTSTYINNPPYFDAITNGKVQLTDIHSARILAVFGDSITTDHISPAGNISKTSPAAKYLLENATKQEDFNSYGSRRGNHEVMMRGTFANIRIKNELCNGLEGGITIDMSGNQASIYDAAMQYKKLSIPLVVFAGKEYGSGSSRDWAAKGPMLLGVKAVIAESYERIHRSNLVGMGIIPLIFTGGMNRKSLDLDGTEEIDVIGINEISTYKEIDVIIRKSGKSDRKINVIAQIFTQSEVEYINNGGILQKVLLGLL